MPTAELQSRTPTGSRTHPSGEDAALVQRMRSGDEGSFEAIFKRHHAPLLSYCRHMLGNQDEAEDALQQAFIRAHKALLGGSPPRELRPWLYAIARNCCLSAIAARRPTAPLEDHTPSLAGLSDQVREREDLRELLADIGKLPEDQRSALLLAELDDLSHEAIATVVGCPVSKVKALVYQARSTLIADRDARDASCRDIREQLSVARGGELRRGPLRRHLSMCTGCRDFQHAVGAQRQSLAAVLPALPSAALAARILGHGALHLAGTAGIGHAGATIAPTAGASAAGGTAAGGSAAGGTAAGGTAAGGASAVAGGGTGIAAAGGTAAGTTAAAGAVGSTSAGAVIGGGVLAKVAVGGAVAALATVGAVAIPHRLAHTSQRVTYSHLHRGSRSRAASPSAATVQAGAPVPSAIPVQPGGSVGGSARVVSASGPGTTEAGLPAIGGLKATALLSLGGASAVALLPANPTPTSSPKPTGGAGSLAAPTGKPIRAGHSRPSARRRARLRRLRHRRRLLKRQRLLKRRHRLKQVNARPHPPAIVPPVPVRPAHKKKTQAVVGSAPGTTPTTPSTGASGRRKVSGHPRQPQAGGTTGTGTPGTGTPTSSPSPGKTPTSGNAGKQGSTPESTPGGHTPGGKGQAGAPAEASGTETASSETLSGMQPVGPGTGSGGGTGSTPTAGNAKQGGSTTPTGTGAGASGHHKKHS
jgi:RNA polymerase sigma factor (sigma-70 family)